MKSFKILLTMLLLIVISACQSEEKQQQNLEWKETKYAKLEPIEGLTMTVVESSVTSTTITVQYENFSEKQYIYSTDFLIEKLIDGKWFEAPVILDEPYGFEDIAYLVDPNQKSKHSVDWDWLYDELDAGEYRIIKIILYAEGEGDVVQQPIAAEFTIP